MSGLSLLVSHESDSELPCLYLQARRTKARLDSWGEFRSQKTDGWTPVPSKSQAAATSYWRSLGAAARFKEEIKRNLVFADALLPAFTQEELIRTLLHVR